jgi:DNA mismatch repair protein MutS
MLDSLADHYKKIINNLLTFSNNIEIIINYISTIDVIYNKAHVSVLYNLSKPIIDDSHNSSFFDVKSLRHPLIENLLQDEIYVPNDICLNNKNLGILLYGINAIGKSSLIKSIGICIIMAQTGFFAPCNSLTYKPYHHIFTRIIGNDNIFKGLSTFAVEMLELNNILKFSNENSLILGDELCSGTENNSATGIILSGINHLYNQKSNFIFATHIHEISDCEEIKSKENMSIKHMSVEYDKEKDNLIYYRKLKDGPGDSMYGLEVCKYLHMPKHFLDYAHNIRNKYFNNKAVLDYKICRYNEKVRGKCELCNDEISTETHHLQHQSNANKNGFIKDFHKNVNGNLLNVCEKCHLKMHKSKNGHIKVKTSSGFILEEL